MEFNPLPMDREEAEAVLSSETENGVYILRTARGGNFALSVKHNTTVQHYLIRRGTEKKLIDDVGGLQEYYEIGQQKFDNMQQLIQYHEHASFTNDGTTLRRPIINLQLKVFSETIALAIYLLRSEKLVH